MMIIFFFDGIVIIVVSILSPISRYQRWKLLEISRAISTYLLFDFDLIWFLFISVEEMGLETGNEFEMSWHFLFSLPS